jgi:hypothetical protein
MVHRIASDKLRHLLLFCATLRWHAIVALLYIPPGPLSFALYANAITLIVHTVEEAANVAQPYYPTFSISVGRKHLPTCLSRQIRSSHPQMFPSGSERNLARR